MTLEEAQKKLTHKKVFVKDKSLDIKTKLKSLGFRLSESEYKKFDCPFLYIKDYKIFVVDNLCSSFYQSEFEEITAEEILSIKIDTEDSGFKPFDKIIARDYDEEWHIDFFEQMKDKMYYCIGGTYNECLTYAGNEHLL